MLGRWKDGWRCVSGDANYVLHTVATQLCSSTSLPPSASVGGGGGGGGGARSSSSSGGGGRLGVRSISSTPASRRHTPSPLLVGSAELHLRLPFEACTLFVARRDPSAVISKGYVYLPALLWPALILERCVSIGCHLNKTKPKKKQHTPFGRH